MHVCVHACGAQSLIALFFLCLWLFDLHVCLCTTCVQCLWRSEWGVRSPEIEVMVVSHHVGFCPFTLFIDAVCRWTQSSLIQLLKSASLLEESLAQPPECQDCRYNTTHNQPFYVGAGDSKLWFYTCMASVSSVAPSPQSQERWSLIKYSVSVSFFLYVFKDF